MYSLDELRQQNKDISELCNVLSVLIEHTELHSNPYLCDLMQRFKEKVWMHLVFEDNTVYAALLRHSDGSVNKTAKAFHDSAREIKHRFSGYVKHWCKSATSNAEHKALQEESRDIFQLIMERVQYENEYMFPLVEKHSR